MAGISEKISSIPVNQMEALVESDRFGHFLENSLADPKIQYISLTLPFENIDPLAILEFSSSPEGTRFFWEKPDTGLTFAAGNQTALIKSNGTERFNSIVKKSERLLSKIKHYSEIDHSLSGPHFLGGFSFFDQPLSGSWSTFGNASFILPEWLIVKDGHHSLITITCRLSSKSTPCQVKKWFTKWIAQFLNHLKEELKKGPAFGEELKPHPEAIDLLSADEKTKWINNVEKAKTWIKQKRFDKIVLAREIKYFSQKTVSATKLIHFLRNQYPSCYSFIYQLNGEAVFLGSTPENLFTLQSRNLKTEALAGSISRGNTASMDTIKEKNLKESTKELKEHAYVRDAIRNKLDCLTNHIDFTSHPIIKKYANVQHLYTPISASLTNEINPVDLISLLHPTPAVGGYPEWEAIHHIQELEQLERGWYAGPVGWFNTHQRADFSVAIRSGLIRRKHIQFFAGCGIVEDSDPETEWEESMIKLLPMQKGLEYATE